MGTAWLLPVLLLALTPDPGISQFGAQLKLCRDCKFYSNEEDRVKLQRAIDGKASNPLNCPQSENIRFKLTDGVICGDKHQSWVIELKEQIKNGWSKKDSSPDSRTDFSKDTNGKPSTTTIRAPTTAPVTSMKPSTQSWIQNVEQSTVPAEPAVATPALSDVVQNGSDPSHYDKENINLQQGHDKSPENPNATDNDSKMQHMRTAIISLIVIVLVMAAVGVGLYCRKKNTNHFNAPCRSGSIGYKAASSQDSNENVSV